MQDDLSTIAENALDALERADGDSVADNDAQDEQSDDKSQDNNNESNDSESEENADNDEASEEADSETAGETEESQDNDESNSDDSEKGKQAQELTDEELLAELEKRGKKPEQQEEKKPDQVVKPVEVPADIWSSMNQVQQYIYQELPYLEARGKDGTVLRVKTDEQVPTDFEWISEQAKNQFYSKDIPAQSVRAENLHMRVQQYAQQQNSQRQTQEQANAVVAGIEELQKQGIVPKITAKPNTPEFNNDPGVVRANDILAVYQEYQGRGESISVETAGQIYKAQHPELYVKKPTKSAADNERKQKSRNIAGTAGRGTASAAKGTDTPRAWPVGTSASDIADYYADQLD